MKHVLLLGALAACSDPGHYCGRGGEHITYDGTCTFAPAAIAIDGDFSDWAPLLAYPPDCPQCSEGQVSVVYATTTTNGEVAIYAQTIGLPFTDATHSYRIQLAPITGPYYSLGWRVRPTMTITMLAYDTRVDGFPVQAAFGESGIELAAPISAMPFTAGANASAELDALEFGPDDWQPGQDFITDPVYYAPICWDAGSPLCKPLR